jgi:hypothetical protein
MIDFVILDLYSCCLTTYQINQLICFDFAEYLNLKIDFTLALIFILSKYLKENLTVRMITYLVKYCHS